VFVLARIDEDKLCAESFTEAFAVVTRDRQTAALSRGRPARKSQ
jgi:hypothetical protein